MFKPALSHTYRLDYGSQPTARHIGVAVVGLGDAGSDLLRALAETPDVRVRWICDIDISRLAKCRPHHPHARVTTRVDRALADAGVDAVVLATPPDTHYELAMLALAAGKHVFIEAPLLAMPCELSDGVAAAARERRRIVAYGHSLLCTPAVRAIKRMIEGRALGDIHLISSSRLHPAAEAGDSIRVIWALGVREFSMLLYWLREMPRSVRAIECEDSVADVTGAVSVTMEFASGTVVDVSLGYRAASGHCRTMVVGSDRMAVYDEGEPEPVRVVDCSGDVSSPAVEQEPSESHLSEFVQAIRAGRQPVWQPTVPSSALRVAQAAEESLRLGGADVSLTGEAGSAHLAHRPILAAG